MLLVEVRAKLDNGRAIVDADGGKVEHDHLAKPAFDSLSGDFSRRCSSPLGNRGNRFAEFQVKAEHGPLRSQNFPQAEKLARRFNRFQTDNHAIDESRSVRQVTVAAGWTQVRNTCVNEQFESARCNRLINFPGRRDSRDRIQVRYVSPVEAKASNQPAGNALRSGINREFALDRTILFALAGDTANDETIFEIKNRDYIHGPSLASRRLR